MLLHELEVVLMLQEPDKQLSHEKLIVYQVSIKFFAASVAIIRNIPKGNADLVDQFRRASTSIPFNIAEGAGKRSRPDTARYFSIALGSALECGAILDVCNILKVSKHEEIQSAKDQLYEIVCMLSKMCR